MREHYEKRIGENVKKGKLEREIKRERETEREREEEEEEKCKTHRK